MDLHTERAYQTTLWRSNSSSLAMGQAHTDLQVASSLVSLSKEKVPLVPCWVNLVTGMEWGALAATTGLRVLDGDVHACSCTHPRNQVVHVMTA